MKCGLVSSARCAHQICTQISVVHDSGYLHLATLQLDGHGLPNLVRHPKAAARQTARQFLAELEKVPRSLSAALAVLRRGVGKNEQHYGCVAIQSAMRATICR